MHLVKMDVDAIKPYPKNPRINDASVAAVAESIQQCGYVSPIIVDEHSVVLAGHTRLKALQRLGREQADVIVVPGLTEDQKKKFRILDNQAGANSQWETHLLAEELEFLDFEGFDFGFDALLPVEQEEQEKPDWKEKTKELTENILNLGYAQFAGVGQYDIPEIMPVRRMPPIEEWIGFNYAKTARSRDKKAVHFFVDDYQFERVWNNPDTYTDLLSDYACVLSPDFSPYGDMPLATQLFNHYRKHWVAAYWQSHGITVIPTIRASTDERSFEWFLDGEPHRSIVAYSSMFIRSGRESERISRMEWELMMKTLEPISVIVYGKVFDWMQDVDIVRVEKFTEKRFSHEGGYTYEERR